MKPFTKQPPKLKVGDKVGSHLTIVAYKGFYKSVTPSRTRGAHHYELRCDCGKYLTRPQDILVGKRTISQCRTCCNRSKPAIKVGERFHRLLMIEYLGFGALLGTRKEMHLYRVKCDCGTTFIAGQHRLKAKTYPKRACSECAKEMRKEATRSYHRRQKEKKVYKSSAPPMWPVPGRV